MRDVGHALAGLCESNKATRGYAFRLAFPSSHSKGCLIDIYHVLGKSLR